MEGLILKLVKYVLLNIGICLSVASCTSFPMVKPTGKLTFNIYAIMNTHPYVNFHLFQIGEKYIAIDTGTNSVQSEKELKKLKISSDDVVAIFITHSHADHIGSINLFNKATVYTGNTILPGINNHILTDNEMTELNYISIMCIYTPGHTSDSVSYLINGKYLFTGDSLINHQNNYDNMLRKLSIEKLAMIDGIEYVFTGHTGFTKNVNKVLLK